MKLALLLALLTVSECDSSRVKVRTGQDVTLPCKYDRKHYGALSVCWQRGEIPTRGCYNPLISTDGDKVLTRASSRYQLLGRLEDGDISLTIVNLTERDAGRYGCRVEIPGWFNDDKHHFDLTVVDDLSITTDTPTSTASMTRTPTESTAASQTEGHVTSTESPLTSSFSEKHSSETMAPLISVLLVLVFLLTLGGLVVAVRRLKQLVSTPQVKVGPAQQVQFSSTSSTLQLQSSTVDNIYQMESNGDSSSGGDGDGGGGDRGGGEDEGDYEYCP